MSGAARERSFVSLLEEAAGAAVPGTAAALEEVRARLEEIRSGWQGEAERLEWEELRRMRAGLGQVRLLVEHAARRRLGLMRHMAAQEMGYTATGEAVQPAATSWECVG